MHKLKNNEARPKFTVSYNKKKKRVEGIVGSSCNSSELNHPGDQAADRQHLEQETIPESSTSR